MGWEAGEECLVVPGDFTVGPLSGVSAQLTRGVVEQEEKYYTYLFFCAHFPIGTRSAWVDDYPMSALYRAEDNGVADA